MGHPIAIVAAETEAQARAAAKAVNVEYEDLPAILDIEDAIAGVPPLLSAGFSERRSAAPAGDVDKRTTCAAGLSWCQT